MNVSEERTGWRDKELSERHREWGWDCPMADLDEVYNDSDCPAGRNTWTCLEYDYGHPKAIMEYKHEYAKKAFEDIIERSERGKLHPTQRATKEVADNSWIPFFVVLYADDLSWFQPYPLNEYARQYIPKTMKLSELEYVTLLYNIRGRTVPHDILKKLRNNTQSHFR